MSYVALNPSKILAEADMVGDEERGTGMVIVLRKKLRGQVQFLQSLN
jgi:hypothetical protein